MRGRLDTRSRQPKAVRAKSQTPRSGLEAYRSFHPPSSKSRDQRTKSPSVVGASTPRLGHSSVHPSFRLSSSYPRGSYRPPIPSFCKQCARQRASFASHFPSVQLETDSRENCRLLSSFPFEDCFFSESENFLVFSFMCGAKIHSRAPHHPYTTARSANTSQSTQTRKNEAHTVEAHTVVLNRIRVSELIERR